jgi:hypothetical protein
MYGRWVTSVTVIGAKYSNLKAQLFQIEYAVSIDQIDKAKNSRQSSLKNSSKNRPAELELMDCFLFITTVLFQNLHTMYAILIANQVYGKTLPLFLGGLRKRYSC